jgi:CDP-diacylglycerol---glycerol-3-phosphate 3-phosphatidyltransferase
VVTSIMVFDYAGYLLWISLLLGLFSELEGVAISLVLPEWTHDVRNLRRAFAIRTEKLRVLA